VDAGAPIGGDWRDVDKEEGPEQSSVDSLAAWPRKKRASGLVRVARPPPHYRRRALARQETINQSGRRAELCRNAFSIAAELPGDNVIQKVPSARSSTSMIQTSGSNRCSRARRSSTFASGAGGSARHGEQPIRRSCRVECALRAQTEQLGRASSRLTFDEDGASFFAPRRRHRRKGALGHGSGGT